MNCASCGSPNREGRRFCGKCGAPLAKLCGSCGAADDADESFCGECGAALGEIAAVRPQATATMPASAPPRGDFQRTAERRHVSVLFADLVGFTSLSDQRDAEDVRELLSRYFDTARTVITRHRGLDLFDKMQMLFWAAPWLARVTAARGTPPSQRETATAMPA